MIITLITIRIEVAHNNNDNNSNNNTIFKYSPRCCNQKCAEGLGLYGNRKKKIKNKNVFLL